MRVKALGRVVRLAVHGHAQEPVSAHAQGLGEGPNAAPMWILNDPCFEPMDFCLAHAEARSELRLRHLPAPAHEHNPLAKGEVMHTNAPLLS
jgi:hypothetical protein